MKLYGVEEKRVSKWTIPRKFLFLILILASFGLILYESRSKLKSNARRKVRFLHRPMMAKVRGTYNLANRTSTACPSPSDTVMLTNVRDIGTIKFQGLSTNAQITPTDAFKANNNNGEIFKSATERHTVNTRTSTVLSTPSATTKPRSKYILPTRKKVSTAKCQALINGDIAEHTRTMNLMEAVKKDSHSGDDYTKMASDCNAFRTTRGYIMNSLTPEEEQFPIAFSILMFKDLEQFERLLRAIYRPQNYYCIHVDKKADSSLKHGMDAIVGCFENVFLAPRAVDVRWGKYSVLEPEIICMRALWAFKKWKYFINLTGQEFPLKTNRELVEILTAYDGANDIEGTVKRANLDRWQNAGHPPHGIRPVKGAVHIVVCRGYVDYLLHNHTARDLLEWVKKTGIPDETYFASLNHNPHLGVPGSYIGEPETDAVKKPFLARFKNWGGWECHGKFVHSICIFGMGDLPLLTSRPELFANKFYYNYQHYTVDCLEEWHYNKTRDEYVYNIPFNTTYYSNVAFVKHKI